MMFMVELDTFECVYHLNLLKLPLSTLRTIWSLDYGEKCCRTHENPCVILIHRYLIHYVVTYLDHTVIQSLVLSETFTFFYCIAFFYNDCTNWLSVFSAYTIHLMGMRLYLIGILISTSLIINYIKHIFKILIQYLHIIHIIYIHVYMNIIYICSNQLKVDLCLLLSCLRPTLFWIAAPYKGKYFEYVFSHCADYLSFLFILPLISHFCKEVHCIGIILYICSCLCSLSLWYHIGNE